MQKIITHLWFDSQAEEAANFYVSVFKNSKVVGISRYTAAASEVAKRPKGSAMTVEFELDGQKFIVPTVLAEMVRDPDAKKVDRAMSAILKMKKLDLRKLEQAYAGE